MSTSRTVIDEHFFADESGCVTRPGPFAGLPVYVAYFFEQAKQDGQIPDEGETSISFLVRGSDRELFPELKDIRFVKFRVRNGEFVEELLS